MTGWFYRFAFLVKPYYWATMKLSAGKRSRVPVFKSITEATQSSAKLRYVADPKSYDNLHHPQHTQWLIEHPDAGGGDCDDYASWWCRAAFPLVDKVWFGFLTWRVGHKDYSHAVCVYRLGTTYYHVGNWFKGAPQICFGAHTPLDALAFFASQVKDAKRVGEAVIEVKGYEKDDALVFGDVQSRCA